MLTLFRKLDGGIPFPGRAAQLQLVVTDTPVIDAGQKEHHPDHVARMALGVDRTPETAPLFALFEHFSNALAGAGAGGSSIDVDRLDQLNATVDRLRTRLEAAEATIRRIKANALTAKGG